MVDLDAARLHRSLYLQPWPKGKASAVTQLVPSPMACVKTSSASNEATILGAVYIEVNLPSLRWRKRIIALARTVFTGRPYVIVPCDLMPDLVIKAQ
jgi:hypothetical protein